MEEKRVTFIFFFFKNRSKESIISNLIIYNFYREKKEKDVRSNIVNIFLTGFRKEERLKIPSLIETLPRRLDALFEGRRREKLVFFFQSERPFLLACQGVVSLETGGWWIYLCRGGGGNRERKGRRE